MVLRVERVGVRVIGESSAGDAVGEAGDGDVEAAAAAAAEWDARGGGEAGDGDGDIGTSDSSCMVDCVCFVVIPSFSC